MIAEYSGLFCTILHGLHRPQGSHKLWLQTVYCKLSISGNIILSKLQMCTPSVFAQTAMVNFRLHSLHR